MAKLFSVKPLPLARRNPKSALAKIKLCDVQAILDIWLAASKTERTPQDGAPCSLARSEMSPLQGSTRESSCFETWRKHRSLLVSSFPFHSHDLFPSYHPAKPKCHSLRCEETTSLRDRNNFCFVRDATSIVDHISHLFIFFLFFFLFCDIHSTLLFPVLPIILGWSCAISRIVLSFHLLLTARFTASA